MKKYSILLVLLLATKLFAWGNVGHEVMARIAWEYIDVETQNKINGLLKMTAPFYEENKSFVTASRWADLIKDGLFAFTNWHYISLPLLVEPLKEAPTLERTNILFGLCQAAETLRKSPRDMDKALMLPMFIHLVGDAHQPMHAVTRYSTQKPSGDMGGNLYFITVDGKRTNLHLYWDLGLGLLGDVHKPYTPEKTESPETVKIAKEWQRDLPWTYFGARISDVNFDGWVKQNFQMAKDQAYQVPEGTAPSDAYISSGQKTVKEQVVLSGYRLAYILQRIFSNQALDLGCAWTNGGKK